MANKRQCGIEDCVATTKVQGNVKTLCGKVRILFYVVSLFVASALASGSVATLADARSKNNKAELNSIKQKQAEMEKIDREMYGMIKEIHGRLVPKTK